jgi:hypothetical protein
VTRKPSGPIGQIEMEKGPIGTRDTQAIGSHRSDEEGSHRYMTSGPTSQMEMKKGPTGTHDTQAIGSRRSDEEGSHRDTSDGERTERRLL